MGAEGELNESMVMMMAMSMVLPVAKHGCTSTNLIFKGATGESVK